MASVNRPAVMQLLRIPDEFEIDSVPALGYPNEEPVAFDLNGSVEYFRDEQDRLHVPKRTMQSVVSHNKFGER